ncbi:MAG: thioredoxin [Defluviitaleaceae bacterium]|nr:thioredoxin [Defluviitaleaceae bacterium]
MSVQLINEQQFDEIIPNSAVPVIVDFYADWCQPCKRIAPVLEEISNEAEGRVVVCKVNVDDNQKLAARFSVMSIPIVISFKNGSVYKRVVGVVPKDELLALIE